MIRGGEPNGKRQAEVGATPDLSRYPAARLAPGPGSTSTSLAWIGSPQWAHRSSSPDGLHPFSNPTDEPVRMLGISTKRFPDVVAYPERGVAWVATRHPGRPVPEGGDQGVIARFELAPDD